MCMQVMSPYSPTVLLTLLKIFYKKNSSWRNSKQRVKVRASQRTQNIIPLIKVSLFNNKNCLFLMTLDIADLKIFTVSPFSTPSPFSTTSPFSQYRLLPQFLRPCRFGTFHILLKSVHIKNPYARSSKI